MISEKDIPEGWELKVLGDVLDIKGGSQPPKSKFIYSPKEGYIQLLQIRDFGEKGVPTYVPINLVSKFCMADDVLIARYGASLGRIVTGLSGAYNVALAKIINDKGYFKNKFLFYLFQTQIFQAPLKQLSRSAQNGFSKGEIAGIQLPIPPKEEQQRIVEKIEVLFSEVDKGIETLQTALQQLKTYRQSVLKHAFEGKLTHPEVKDGELPEGWEWVKLGDVVEKRTEKGLPKEYPDFKFIGMDSIEPQTLKPSKIYCFSEFKSSGNLFYKNDVLYGRMRPYLNKVYKTDFQGACSGEFIVLICNETFSPDLLKYILHSKEFVSFANSKTTGDRPRISFEEIIEYSFPKGSIEEQRQIVSEIESRLSVADKLEESITHSLQQAHALKQSILKKAFEGKLVTTAKPHKVSTVDYFKQVQVVAATLLAIKKTGKIIPEGEMAFAKGLYLIDRIYGVNTGLNYKRWHLGPYAPELKKIINNKQYFIKPTNGQTWLSLKSIDTVLKYNNPELGKVENAVSRLNAIFQKYSASEKSHKIELLATVCKVIEDIQSTDIDAVWQSMESWEINLPKTVFKTKAQKFTKEETSNCINFIVKNGWNEKLMKLHV